MPEGGATGRLRTGFAVGGLALWPFIYFWKATSGEVLLWPHDGFLYSLPTRLLAARLIAAGELPLWNPYVFSGFPLFAEMQTGVLSPGVWLFWLLPMVTAANLQMILTYPIAAVGTYAYTRRIGCTRLAAMFGASCFAYGGSMVAHVGHVAMPQGIAMLPWLLWALDWLRTGIRLRWVGAAALALTVAFLAGYPPTLMYLLLVAGLYTAAVVLATRPAPGRVRYLAACGAAVVLGLLLASVQMVPTIELAQQSVRARLTFGEFVEFALPVWQLPMLLFPFLFGGPPPVPYWGAWNIWELSGYVGVTPWMLALAAVPLARRSPIASFWIALAVFSLLLVLADATPLARLAFHVPGFNLFRAQARHLLELDLALAVLAALALTAAPRAALIAGAATIAALISITALLVVRFGAAWWAPLAIASHGETVGMELMAGLTPSNPAVWVPVALAISGAAMLIIVAHRRSVAAVAALLALQLADLWYFGDVMSVAYPQTRWVELSRPWVVDELEGIAPPGSGRVAIVGDSRGPLDLRPMLWGIPLVNGYDPFLLARYRQFAGNLSYWGYIPSKTLTLPLWLDLLSTRWVIQVHGAEPPRGQQPGVFADATRWIPRRVTAASTVLENQRARPRAWLVGRTVALPPEEILRTIQSGRFADGQPFDPGREALIEQGPGTAYGGPQPPGEVTVVSSTANAIEVVTRAEHPAFLVASEIDYPGWQASIDGAAVPITRTNFVLRGIEVGAGEHRVRMVFAPRSLIIGLMISALTTGAFLIVGILRWRANRTNRAG
jgi:hypothetical protein